MTSIHSRHGLARWPFVIGGLLAAMAIPTHATDASHHLAPLTWFLGQWHCRGTLPGGNTIQSRETFSMALDGHWMRMRHHDLPPHHYKAVEWWGYDRITKHFVVGIYGNAGSMRQYTSSGWENDTLSLHNIATRGYIDRFVFRRLGKNRYRVTYDHKRGSGPWQHGDALVCARVHRQSRH